MAPLRVFVFFLLIACTQVVNAAGYCAVESEQQTRVYFVNGVWNTRLKASLSLGRIRVAYQRYLQEN